MLRIDEAPRIEVHIVESTEDPGGMGEPVTYLRSCARRGERYLRGNRQAIAQIADRRSRLEAVLRRGSETPSRRIARLRCWRRPCTPRWIYRVLLALIALSPRMMASRCNLHIRFPACRRRDVRSSLWRPQTDVMTRFQRA